MLKIIITNKQGKSNKSTEAFEILAEEMVKIKVNGVNWSMANITEIEEQVIAEEMGYDL